LVCWQNVSDDSPVPTAVALASAPGTNKRYLALVEQDVRNMRRSLSENGGYWLTIRDAHHANFSDGLLYTPIKWITGASPFNVRRALAFINEYTRSFFDKQLMARDNGLLGGNRRTAQVDFEAWPSRADAVPGDNHKAVAGKLEALLDEYCLHRTSGVWPGHAVGELFQW
jgi:hypothetical protein